ncbi:DUF4240 domain-containing protein [Streptomyces sp. S1]|uniref:DUF4240 domain-containing protein n=1 Tax=Streptomyces sp. S1 TaxID=718288 RepID=UPI003D75577A
MDIDRFWQVIKTARSSAATSGKPLDEMLVSLLAVRPSQEILEYAARFDEVRDGLYWWDVWAAHGTSAPPPSRTVLPSTLPWWRRCRLTATRPCSTRT